MSGPELYLTQVMTKCLNDDEELQGDVFSIWKLEKINLDDIQDEICGILVPFKLQVIKTKFCYHNHNVRKNLCTNKKKQRRKKSQYHRTGKELNSKNNNTGVNSDLLLLWFYILLGFRWTKSTAVYWWRAILHLLSTFKTVCFL